MSNKKTGRRKPPPPIDRTTLQIKSNPTVNKIGLMLEGLVNQVCQNENIKYTRCRIWSLDKKLFATIVLPTRESKIMGITDLLKQRIHTEPEAKNLFMHAVKIKLEEGQSIERTFIERHFGKDHKIL